jgi:hypothetical protein
MTPTRAGGARTGKKGSAKEKVPAGKTGPPPPKKLTARQRELRQEVQRLNDAIKDDRSRRGKTIAAWW